MKFHPLCRGISFYLSLSFFFQKCDKTMKQGVKLHKTIACTGDIISNAPAVITISRLDVFACTLLIDHELHIIIIITYSTVQFKLAARVHQLVCINTFLSRFKWKLVCKA